MKQYDEEEMILRQLTMGSNPYQAPQGYFDKLPGMVMQKVKTRHRRRTTLRWAVAAVMTGCIATAGFLLHQQDLPEAPYHELEHKKNINKEQKYSMIGNTEIEYYLTEAE